MALRNCPDCGGSGREELQCVQCDGHGWLECDSCSSVGSYMDWSTGTRRACVACGGKGKTFCYTCRGTGSHRERCITCSGSGQLTYDEYDQVIAKRTRQRMEAERLRQQETAKFAAPPERKRRQRVVPPKKERIQNYRMQFLFAFLGVCVSFAVIIILGLPSTWQVLVFPIAGAALGVKAYLWSEDYVLGRSFFGAIGGLIFGMVIFFVMRLLDVNAFSGSVDSIAEVALVVVFIIIGSVAFLHW